MNELSPFIDGLSKLGPFGLLVVFIWLVGSGRLILKRELDRERERTAEEREERKKTEARLDESLPVLQRAIEGLNRAAVEVPKAVVETTAKIVEKQKDGARQ